MLSLAIGLIREELSRYILEHQRNDNPIGTGDIVLANIANLENDNSNLDGKVVITLVNVEEESTLKNSQLYQRNPISNGVQFKKPPININSYLLFSVPPNRNVSENAISDDYGHVLNRLSLILEFFQSKKHFTVQNSPHSSLASNVNIDDVTKEEIKISMELYTLTFEQINHLWGSLGGKQVPSVMYKIRLIKIENRQGTDSPLIQEINNNFKDLAID